MFEGEFQLYGRIIDAKIKYQNSDIFTKTAKESSVYVERFDLVDEPIEYILLYY
jgi:hypothetical protein